MRRGNTLVATMMVFVIIAILAVVVMRGNNVFGAPGTGSKRADGRGTTIPGAAIAGSKDVVCRQHLYDLRMAIGMVHDTDGDEKWPASLQETKQGADFYKCPLGGEPYKYDPATGTVKCVHPGHEKY